MRAARAAVAAAVLEQGRGQTLWLALDETHQGHTETGARLGMLALRLVLSRAGDPARLGLLPSRARPRRRSRS